MGVGVAVFTAQPLPFILSMAAFILQQERRVVASDGMENIYIWSYTEDNFTG